MKEILLAYANILTNGYLMAWENWIISLHSFTELTWEYKSSTIKKKKSFMRWESQHETSYIFPKSSLIIKFCFVYPNMHFLKCFPK